MNKNDLIPIICQEECAEVIQAISKVFRFGLEQVNPYTGNTNRYELATEMGQLKCMLLLLEDKWKINQDDINAGSVTKALTLDKWNDYFDRKPNEESELVG